MIDAQLQNVRLEIEQGHDRCLVKINGMLVENLEAVSVTMGNQGTVATLMFTVDDLKIEHELNRVVAGQAEVVEARQ